MDKKKIIDNTGYIILATFCSSKDTIEKDK